MLAYVRTPSRATCKGVLQLEAAFIDVKKTCVLQVAPEGVLTGLHVSRPSQRNCFYCLYINVVSSRPKPLFGM